MSLFTDYFSLPGDGEEGNISFEEKIAYVASGTAAAAISSLTSALMPKQTGSCVAGAANIISTGTNLAWFIRDGRREVKDYFDMSTSVGGLALLSTMDMLNCAAPTMLKGN